MTRHLKIAVESGPTTCAVSLGKFCKYVITSHWGTVFFCSLFFDGRAFVELRDVDGWLQRCPACLEAEKA